MYWIPMITTKFFLKIFISMVDIRLRNFFVENLFFHDDFA